MKPKGKSLATSIWGVTVYLLIILYGAVSPEALSGELTVSKKCTVKAGKYLGEDSIRFSGLLDATEADFSQADTITISFDSDGMPEPLVCVFPIDDTSLKKGKYNYTHKENASQTQFKYDTKKGACLFSAKNIDLTGLSCPMAVEIQIGSYVAQAQLDENLVNGPKKPCPMQLLMGVTDSLSIDKYDVRLGSKPGSDAMKVAGSFTMAGEYDTANPLRISWGDETLTIPGQEFVSKNAAQTCSRAPSEEGPLVSAKFDFDKCQYEISVENMVIQQSGPVTFEIDLFDHVLSMPEASLNMSDHNRYELETYRGYNQPGASWTYQADYSIQDSDGLLNDSGSGTATVSVSNSPRIINGCECLDVTVSGSESNMTSCWYEDYWGMHQLGWGSFNDLVQYDLQMDALMAVPKVLEVGQSFQDSGSFAGTLDYDISTPGIDIDVTGFQGKVDTDILLVGFESVSVPAGNFPEAAKVQAELNINGSMNMEIDYFGEHFKVKAKIQATIAQTWWGVENLGVVQGDTDMLMKISLKGESIWVNMIEHDVLIDYNNGG